MSPQPSEIKMSKISRIGRFDLDLSIPVQFPTNVTDIVKLSVGTEAPILDFVMVTEDLYEIDDNPMTWSLVEATNSSLSVQLEFEKPKEVASGQEQVKILAFVDLSKFID